MFGIALRTLYLLRSDSAAIDYDPAGSRPKELEMNTTHAAHVATEFPALIGHLVARLLAAVLRRSRSTQRTPVSAETAPSVNPLPYHAEPSPGDLVIQCVRGRVSVGAFGDCYLNGRPLSVKATREAELRYAMTMEATKLL